MELIAQGRLSYIGPITAYGANNFEKREFAIMTDEQYPQTVLFELHQGNVSKIDQFQLNEMVSLKFNLKGRTWVNPQGETKYFNTLQAWYIAHLTGTQPQAPQQQPAQPQQAPAQQPVQQPAQAPAPPASPQAAPVAPVNPMPAGLSQAEQDGLKNGYKHTSAIALDALQKNGWTYDQLVAHKYGEYTDLPF